MQDGVNKVAESFYRHLIVAQYAMAGLRDGYGSRSGTVYRHLPPLVVESNTVLLRASLHRFSQFFFDGNPIRISRRSAGSDKIKRPPPLRVT